MERSTRKLSSIFLAVVMVGCLLPIRPAVAVDMQNNVPTITSNIAMSDGTVIGFAGQQWWVIGYNGTGIHTSSGNTNSVTLLLKSTSSPYGNTAFRNMSETSIDSWTEFPSGSENWYEGSFTDIRDYKNSTLQTHMNSNSVLGTFPIKEWALINQRTLTASDDPYYQIMGGDVADQKIWPLSFYEWGVIDDSVVRSFGTAYWLRSPGGATNTAIAGLASGSDFSVPQIQYTGGARPALNLDLSSVIFSSATNGTNSKSTAEIGDGLIGTTTPTEAIKLTVQDPSLTLSSVTPTSASGRTVTFDYAGATTDKTLSAIVESDTGVLKYYGKLAVSATTGSASVTLPDDFVRTDKLLVFVEEANDDNYTDFASMPIELAVTTVINPASAIQFTHNVATAKTYNGKAQGVTVTPKAGVGDVTAIKYNGSTTKPTNSGSYKVTIDVRAGTQYGAKTDISLGTFKINKADLSKIKATITDMTWTGSQRKPTKFTYNGVNFTISSHATVKKYGTNKNIGKGTIQITGKGTNFTGTGTITFKIVPKTNSISKITVGTKQMKVTWNKVSAVQRVSKYQVRYRVKGSTTWTTKTYASSISSATIKSLLKGKQYEVQTRSYKTILGINYISAWSATKLSASIK